MDRADEIMEELHEVMKRLDHMVEPTIKTLIAMGKVKPEAINARHEIKVMLCKKYSSWYRELDSKADKLSMEWNLERGLY